MHLPLAKAIVHSCGSTVNNLPSYRISAFDIRLIFEPNSGIIPVAALIFFYGSLLYLFHALIDVKNQKIKKHLSLLCQLLSYSVIKWIFKRLVIIKEMKNEKKKILFCSVRKNSAFL